MTSTEDTATPTKRRRWPFLLMMLGMAAAAGTAAALRSRRSAEPTLMDDPDQQITPPRPRNEQEQKQFNRQP